MTEYIEALLICPDEARPQVEQWCKKHKLTFMSMVAGALIHGSLNSFLEAFPGFQMPQQGSVELTIPDELQGVVEQIVVRPPPDYQNKPKGGAK